MVMKRGPERSAGKLKTKKAGRVKPLVRSVRSNDFIEDLRSLVAERI